jgi:hypothetical protein
LETNRRKEVFSFTTASKGAAGTIQWVFGAVFLEINRPEYGSKPQQEELSMD